MATCESLDRGPGTLGCLSDCSDFDATGCAPLCGNGQLEGGEPCDDANDVSGDGCEGDCTLTPGMPAIVVCQELAPLPDGERCAVTTGNERQLITGDILVPDKIYVGGMVLVDAAGVIECVGCDCDVQAAGATEILCPEGVVSPGLINAHDHLTFSHNDPYDVGRETYDNRHDWRLGARTYQQIPVSVGANADQVRWGELRFVMGGATSTVGDGGEAGFLRNLDSDEQEGLAHTPVHVESFPLDDAGGTTRRGSCNYGVGANTEASIANDAAYFADIAEGVDASARNEFLCVSSGTFDTTAPGTSHNLLQPQTALVHAIGLKPHDYAHMAHSGTSLIWSPRSNIALYGDTAVVTVAARMGVRIALGTDWIRTGSMNLIRELHCADVLNGTYYGHFFTDQDLWMMATSSAAAASATDDAIGVLATDHLADIAVFDGSVHAAHRAVIDAQPQDVVLVMRGGKSLYGDEAVIASLAEGCDTLNVCGSEKRVCTQSEVGQSLMQLSSANAFRYPAFFCGTPQFEPSCQPARWFTTNDGTSYEGTITDMDQDGDGLFDPSDNCPLVFNPIRPLDDGIQADFDDDGHGDACDVCPLDPDVSTCTAFEPEDRDHDGLPDATDNCPDFSSSNQDDADADGKGDVCDDCPVANPGGAGCPRTTDQIKNGSLVGDAVVVSNVLVTAKAVDGFYIQGQAGDAEPASHLAMFVRTGDSPADVAVGNRVTVHGFTELVKTRPMFFYPRDIQLTNVISIEVTPTIELPQPTDIVLEELPSDPTMLYLLEGALVSIPFATVTAPMDPLDEFTVRQGNATLDVDDYLYLASPSPAVGKSYRRATGILTFREDVPKLLLRDAGDLDETFALASFGPDLSFLHPDDVWTTTFPQPLTVTLNAPAPVDTFVAIRTSLDTTVSVVDGGVTIPAGQTSAEVLLNAESIGSVLLFATLDTVEMRAEVNVRHPAEQPLLVDLQPHRKRLPAGATQTLTLTLNHPAGEGGEIIDLSGSGLGTFPSTVVVEEDQLTASFVYSYDEGYSGSEVVTATHGGQVQEAYIQVATGAIVDLVINEIDYGQPGLDSEEFVEIYNGTGVGIPTSDLYLVFIDGSSNREYFIKNGWRMDLSLFPGVLPPDTYVVYGSNEVVAPGGMLRSTVQNDLLRAPGAVGIYDAATDTLIDVVAFEGNVTPVEPGGDYREGGSGLSVSQVGGEAEEATSTGSLCRLPDGTDTDVTTSDWSYCAVPTPGAPNVQ